MHLLTFHPILKRALWGGQRLGSALNKPLGSATDYAESWEVADLPNDVSIANRCHFTGKTLREILLADPQSLLGCQAESERFPLLIKFLDARERLSIQVHPSRQMAARHPAVTTGKAETWVILDAAPGSHVYAGLKPGVDSHTLRHVAATPAIVDCLHSYEVQVGDCISLLPGTVHAIGAGLLLAEIQEPNNVTYRLSDWGRIDAAGNPRELHLEQALEATNFQHGPVNKVVPQQLAATGAHEQLVHSEHFVLHRHYGPKSWQPDDDNRAHVLVLLAGGALVATAEDRCELAVGQTLVLPAQRPNATISLSESAILLDAWVDETLTNRS